MFFIVVGVVGFGVFLYVVLLLKLFLFCGVFFLDVVCGDWYVGMVFCFCFKWFDFEWFVLWVWLGWLRDWGFFVVCEKVGWWYWKVID